MIIVVADCRELAQFAVRLVIAGQGCERHAGLGQMCRVLLKRVSPIARAAQEPRDDQARFCRAIGDMQIDRHRVTQVVEAGQPDRGGIVQRCAGLRQGGKFGVGHRKKHDVGGRLAQIEGFRAIVDRPRGGGEQVHQP